MLHLGVMRVQRIRIVCYVNGLTSALFCVYMWLEQGVRSRVHMLNSS